MALAATKTPQEILSELLKIAVEVCEADTAGISLVEKVPGEDEIFRWVAMAGKLAQAAGGWTPRDASPCGVTMARGEPQLFDHPGRLFPELAAANIVEGLVMPISTESECFGTIWIVTHARTEAFDMEDVRMMRSLAAFSAMACLLSRAHRGEGSYRIAHLKSRI
jgi:GAF domain-containing protein